MYVEVRAEDLKPGMKIDLEPLWTFEYDQTLYAYASSEYGVVEAVEVCEDQVVVFLEAGPANAIVPAGYEFNVY
ncbi:hypothetical protein AU152_gp67 [Mycobacterium phage Phlei]|uniref:Uncharacterized protein n=1 Tax=Mycobacterium phage Phlei TaxID=1690684 RepID=A0A0N9BDS2_9CAUD|nr:hypothetical protein AU152_gp67 [Mycobacterium phage Phlei]ALA48180.1 hypothetical protein [Mycobacterium phage Phlei]